VFEFSCPIVNKGCSLAGRELVYIHQRGRMSLSGLLTAVLTRSLSYAPYFDTNRCGVSGGIRRSLQRTLRAFTVVIAGSTHRTIHAATRP
jgi:hypothetical protein